VLDWLSDHRASIALVVIIGLAIAFVASIYIGIKQTRLRARDQVFGGSGLYAGYLHYYLFGFIIRGVLPALYFQQQQTNYVRWPKLKRLCHQ
jgi:hypothetical protein